MTVISSFERIRILCHGYSIFLNFISCPVSTTDAGTNCKVIELPSTGVSVIDPSQKQLLQLRFDYDEKCSFFVASRGIVANKILLEQTVTYIKETKLAAERARLKHPEWNLRFSTRDYHVSNTWMILHGHDRITWTLLRYRYRQTETYKHRHTDKQTHEHQYIQSAANK